MPDYPIPKRTTDEQLLKVVQGYYSTGGHNNPVSSTEVDDIIGTSDVTGRQTSFLEEIGIVGKDGRQRMLTDSGSDIGEALMGNNEDLAREKFRTLLNDWEFTEKITGFVEMGDEPTDEALTQYIKSNASSDDARGISALVDLLVWSDILEKNDSGDYITANDPVTASDPDHESGQTPSNPRQGDQDTKKDSSAQEQSQFQSNGSDQFNISFEFSADDDPQDIEETITAARRAIELDLSDD
ncbi:hypothetical protein [Halobaculum gomorrense]|uniref:DUF5343 domain-containing protein n=1 Tax=Halobaculum gomorrense TaxID=43928 RepID=A0A1M5URA0_9EURY|nr:hypothetical protein [Halobaculum gomorrense]SHH65509.1 hypothetical protein SAMN05443636_3101 [Halobaculum gomorrense]